MGNTPAEIEGIVHDGGSNTFSSNQRDGGIMDILIKGGLIVDGTGEKPFYGIFAIDRYDH